MGFGILFSYADKLMLEFCSLLTGEPLEINFEKVVQETLNQNNPGQVPPGLVNEVSKQQVLVQYLKVSVQIILYADTTKG